MSRIGTAMRAILENAHRHTENCDAIETVLHNAKGGFAAQTPGAGPATPTAPPEMAGECQDFIEQHVRCLAARPCLIHDTPVAMTKPETSALTPDRAAIDLVVIAKATKIIRREQAKIDRVHSRWTPALTASATAKKLAGTPVSIWCHNCAIHGFNNTRDEERTECRFCADFRRRWGVLPTRDIIDRLSRGIPLTNQFITSELDRKQPGWRKKMPTPKAPKRKQKGSRAA